jgi:hypothetical protein
MNEYETYLKADLSHFIDEWIAIVDDAIVAHNKDPKKAYEEAVRKSHGKTPMLAKVPGKEILVV